jgi:peptidoglycan/LPS O-acetylase OafA/YrhL
MTVDEKTYGVLQPIAPRSSIRELNGLRGLAAIIVFLAHAIGMYPDASTWGRGYYLTYRFFRSANSWVDVFFVLSGFLITTLLLQRRTNHSYFRDFYIRRALRILPVYVFALLLAFITFSHSVRYIIVCTLFLANFASVLHATGEGPFWTLAIEEHFYLIWPAIVHRQSIQWLARIAIIATVLVNVLRFAAASIGHHNFSLTFLRFDGLALGALLGCHFTLHPLGHPRRRSEHLWLWGSFLSGLALVSLAYLYPPLRSHLPYSEAVLAAGVSFFYAGWVGLLIANTNAPGLGFFRSRFLGFFSLISYAFYMFHMYIIVTYDAHTRLRSGDLTGYLLRLLYILLGTVLLSLASRYALELPFLSLRKRFLPPSVPKAETELPLTEA